MRWVDNARGLPRGQIETWKRNKVKDRECHGGSVEKKGENSQVNL